MDWSYSISPKCFTPWDENRGGDYGRVFVLAGERKDKEGDGADRESGTIELDEANEEG